MHVFLPSDLEMTHIRSLQFFFILNFFSASTQIDGKILKFLERSNLLFFGGLLFLNSEIKKENVCERKERRTLCVAQLADSDSCAGGSGANILLLSTANNKCCFPALPPKCRRVREEKCGKAALNNSCANEATSAYISPIRRELQNENTGKEKKKREKKNRLGFSSGTKCTECKKAYCERLLFQADPLPPRSADNGTPHYA